MTQREAYALKLLKLFWPCRRHEFIQQYKGLQERDNSPRSSWYGASRAEARTQHSVGSLPRSSRCPRGRVLRPLGGVVPTSYLGTWVRSSSVSPVRISCFDTPMSLLPRTLLRAPHCHTFLPLPDFGRATLYQLHSHGGWLHGFVTPCERVL